MPVEDRGGSSEAVFIYYELFDDPDPSKIVVELVLSSDGATARVNWKSKTDKAVVDFIGAKGGLLSNVPVSNRLYDEGTHVWTLIGHYGKVILTHLESFITQGLLPAGTTLTKTTDLGEKVLKGRLNRASSTFENGAQKYKEEDFFYSAPVSSSEPTGAQLTEKLAVLIGIDVATLSAESDNAKLKKLYRAAAMRLHPDRNNGDGSKMSELNMLWNLFMQRS